MVYCCSDGLPSITILQTHGKLHFIFLFSAVVAFTTTDLKILMFNYDEFYISRWFGDVILSYLCLTLFFVFVDILFAGEKMPINIEITFEIDVIPTIHGQIDQIYYIVAVL